jgi:hypothetical protein
VEGGDGAPVEVEAPRLSIAITASVRRILIPPARRISSGFAHRSTLVAREATVQPLLLRSPSGLWAPRCPRDRVVDACSLRGCHRDPRGRVGLAEGRPRNVESTATKGLPSSGTWVWKRAAPARFQGDAVCACRDLAPPRDHVAVFLFVQPAAFRDFDETNEVSRVVTTFLYEYALVPCEFTHWRPLSPSLEARCSGERTGPAPFFPGRTSLCRPWRRCSCTPTGCTSSATCGTFGSSATTSRTGMDLRATSASTCSFASRPRWARPLARPTPSNRTWQARVPKRRGDQDDNDGAPTPAAWRNHAIAGGNGSAPGAGSVEGDSVGDAGPGAIQMNEHATKRNASAPTSNELGLPSHISAVSDDAGQLLRKGMRRRRFIRASANDGRRGPWSRGPWSRGPWSR